MRSASSRVGTFERYMARQPYIYTMPEGFLKDEAVPARWKVLAIVQGFWLGGKTCFVTNEWIMKQTNYSERQVQNALSELESMDLVTRNIHGLKRLILPGGCNQTAPGGATRVHPGGATRLHHTSVISNSVNIIGANAPRVITYEDPDKPLRKETRSKDKLIVFRLFSESSQPWYYHKQQKEAALRLFDRGVDRLEAGLEIMRENADDQFCPQAHTPFEYEQKLPKLNAYKKKHGL